MKKKIALILPVIALAITFLSFDRSVVSSAYRTSFLNKLYDFKKDQEALVKWIQENPPKDTADIRSLKEKIQRSRLKMKGIDFWLRYLEPVAYKKINGPLPVEWETEVFEKFEKPYKRDGAGLALATLSLEEETINKDHLTELIQSSAQATAAYTADTVLPQLEEYGNVYLCNRLYLLNLAAIYTTGFECPDTKQIIPELRQMMSDVTEIYTVYNESFAATAITPEYLRLYDKAITFVNNQPSDYEAFDHFTFIKDYVNPLFRINQELIREYRVFSRSMVDYTLNKTATSIFDKTLYNGQNSKGIFLRVKDSAALAEIDRIGKLLFFDPILSGNNSRSCASCHKPNEYFTDNTLKTSPQFNNTADLARNTPSLVNATYNHLIMLDGKHISLQHQVIDVITNKEEMGAEAGEVLKKILSCKVYSTAFKKFLSYTPQETEVTMEHIASAITFYYGKFSKAYSPFDQAMNEDKMLNPEVKAGFNLFMSKAQCATCHFAPQFNGVKPPYVSSEFEVLGVPEDTTFRKLSPDKGRHSVNPATETDHAFRTGTVRNAEHTAPYMHNGVFKTLDQVVDFYNNGGGAGRGLQVDNQTLSADSLGLSPAEKARLITFIKSLNEDIAPEQPPAHLPGSRTGALNKRVAGGTY